MFAGGEGEGGSMLLNAFRDVEGLLSGVGGGKGGSAKGYLFGERGCDEVHDYAPFVLKQYQECDMVSYQGFDMAVDEYYAALERDRSERAGESGSTAAKKKVSPPTKRNNEKRRATPTKQNNERQETTTQARAQVRGPEI